MKIWLNGEAHEIDAGTTIASLVDGLGLERGWVVVERNLTVPERERWEEVVLEPDDQVELVRFMGGG